VATREKFDPTSNEVADNLASQTCDCLYYVDLTTGYFRCIFAKDEVVSGFEGDVLVKGLLHTETLLHAVLNKEWGLLPNG
ncbi:hypothetical protein, partial [Vibrio cholerae]|uniref:hypothetical protein n=1 Tax=Vibrio cholerae TaxID=666 RepID=UPI001C112B19